MNVALFEPPILLADVWQYVFGILMFVVAVFLILLVLVQRGRGGGLAGAFGGMGGQSAFGTKAGDLFTRITIVTAGVWILLCIMAIATLNRQHSVFGTASPPPGPAELESTATPAEEGEAATKGGSNPEAPAGAASAAPAESAAGAAMESGGEPAKQE